jgi:hypothetical protein
MLLLYYLILEMFINVNKHFFVYIKLWKNKITN